MIRYRNSFLPHVCGTFIPHDTGTTIRIRMTLHPLVIAFLVCWTGFFGFFGLVGILEGTHNAIYTFLMPGAVMLAACAGFFMEADGTKSLLSEVIMDVQRKAANRKLEKNDTDSRPSP